MKLRLAAAIAALAVAAPAAAAPPQPAARAYFVQNGSNGEVLLARNADTPLPIASITKLMTVLVALERAKPDDVVVVAPGATSVGGSTINLRPGEQITVGDLVKAALIQSANDAAYALAYHVGGGSVDAFVAMMNEKAVTLGLTHTHFTRPDGLDTRGHAGTARDMTLLGRAAMQNELVRSIVDDRTATIAGGRRLHTWNDLLGTFPRVVGVKTGHTSLAGWSQVAAARGHGYTIYATILGSPSRGRRNADLKQLLAWGLSRYRAVDVVQPARVYAAVATEYGREDVSLVADGGARVVVRVDRPLREVVVAPAAVELPVRRGQRLGYVQVWDGRTLKAQKDLYAANGVERPGFFSRMRWYASRTLSNAVGIFS